MKFNRTSIDDVYIIDIEPISDKRGSFGKMFCELKFREQGLIHNFVQGNIAFTHKRGTIRGLHYQTKPYEEAKLIRCVKGAIFDVVIDLRRNSPTYKRWLGTELHEKDSNILYVPEGFANGYQSLADDTEAFYLSSGYYMPEYERGIRWSDPAFSIEWPITDGVIVSEKDSEWHDFDDLNKETI